MGFTQTFFLFVFLPASILIYLAVYKYSDKDINACNIVLIVEGLVFFWWAVPKLALFYTSLAIFIYFLGKEIYRAKSNNEKREFLLFGVLTMIFIVAIYKYLPSLQFLNNDNQAVVVPLFHNMIVPVGISFFTLGSISYLADIYKGKTSPGNLTEVFLFAMLFPKALCGPIVLWRNFKPQINERRTSVDDLSEGIKRIVVGYAKKAIIADTLAAEIASIENKMAAPGVVISDMPIGVDTVSVWLLLLLLFVRIYTDFSGYSDIAIGICKIFGFKIGENFDYPYLSKSVTEFWRRWHISFWKWFKTYVYNPLAMNIAGGAYTSILITFCIAGLWHGWRLNLLLCGAMNGIIVAVEKKTFQKAWYKKIPRFLRTLLTMLWIMICCLMLKSDSMLTVVKTLQALVVPIGKSPNFTWQYFATKRTILFTCIGLAGAVGLIRGAADRIRKKMGITAYDILEKCVLVALLAIDIMFVISTSYNAPFYSIF